MLAGYATTHHHPHDQRYYRRWMHELPPMQHIKRLTVIDVHHAIVPETARTHPDTPEFLRAAVPIAGWPASPCWRRTDMVLHSATHLFHNEEFSHGLRDLVDIDQLLRHFGTDGQFWAALTGVPGGSISDACSTTRCGSPRGSSAPRSRESTMDAASRYAPAPGTGALMDRLLLDAPSSDRRARSTRCARRLLYLRGHWLKMPVPLLAWHLTVKTFRARAATAGVKRSTRMERVSPSFTLLLRFGNNCLV